MDAHKSMSENPNTAVEKDEIKSTPTKKKKRHHRHQKFEIPGVHKLALNELTQKKIGCVVGENVTVEKPWKYVEKEVLLDNLESESSQFLPIKDEILQYLGEEILIGYVPDESGDYDEFYVCVTESATIIVKNLIEKNQRIQEEKLRNAIIKKVKPWTSLGSEIEVEETITRNNRALIEIEVESKYPILPFKIHFRQTKSGDVRDGYMELRTIEETPNVYKKRIDCYIQVSPSVDCTEAQTKCTYPSNFATQYEYVIPQQESRDFFQVIEEFFRRGSESFFDLLRVNGAINLYADDYKNLILNQQWTIRKLDVRPTEFISFINMSLCENKQISGITWHPTWTGIVVLSYVNISPSVYIDYRIKTDEVNRAVHGNNPVLLWTFQDELNPKLIMEAPREVYSLSFCPFDENLLVGGMVNGQIIIWDLTNKLAKVENENIVTKYRNRMRSLMDWMKDIENINQVRPTAISNLKYSHNGCINMIKWMSPKHQISKTGKIIEVEDSTQLLTSAEDGTILVWDLTKSSSVIGSYKKSRRLKRKPSALIAETSPFKPLHLTLKPVFCIRVNHPLDNSRPLSICTFLSKFFVTHYERVVDKDIKLIPLEERIIYKIESTETKIPFDAEVLVGTFEGDFIQGTWEGHEFDSGEAVNHDDIKSFTFSKYHDGPVVSVAYSPIMDLIMTVGGKIFALWKPIVKNHPILWRKTKAIYTYGSFFRSDEMHLKLSSSEGYIEIWSLFTKSKVPAYKALFANGPISLLNTHPRIMKEIVFGYGDYHGSFRVFILPPHSLNQPCTILFDKFTKFINREIDIKTEISKWQQQWNEKYSEYIEIRNQNENKIKQNESVKELGHFKKSEVKVTAGHEKLKKIILTKKHLDTEELETQRMPLKKLEEENENKKRKQKQKLKQSDKIFQDTVAIFFPDLVKLKPEPPIDPYICQDSTEKMNKCYKEFQEISVKAQDFVDEHPFEYDFDWNRVIALHRNRRRNFDKNKHFERHQLHKRERIGQISNQETTDE